MPRRAGFGLVGVLLLVLAQLLAEGLTGDPEDPRRLRLVVLGLVEGVDDLLALHVGQRHQAGAGGGGFAMLEKYITENQQLKAKVAELEKDKG